MIVFTAFYGILFGIMGVIMNDFDAVKQNGFFQGYSGITWFVVSLQVGRISYFDIELTKQDRLSIA